ncbi:uncharacterized protein BXZ73DRAFT_105955 [Epithele typhae]|uniref:uncharacterized protein n=1 Tax=Epithele typhae TaxID=378194 RepID=UPI002008C662|nr:uncharacterized protein BXZ73DRAFT_105955 [Epithele typhae]KAH9916096.1 hypothetical protein BXZ73DRAFT_105955 [Epithele typhae]
MAGRVLSAAKTPGHELGHEESPPRSQSLRLSQKHVEVVDWGYADEDSDAAAEGGDGDENHGAEAQDSNVGRDGDNDDDEGKDDEDEGEDDLVGKNDENLKRVLRNEAAEWVHNDSESDPELPSLDLQDPSTSPSSFRNSQHAAARTQSATTKKLGRSKNTHAPQRKPDSVGSQTPGRKGLKRTSQVDESELEDNRHEARPKPQRKKVKVSNPGSKSQSSDPVDPSASQHKSAGYGAAPRKPAFSKGSQSTAATTAKARNASGGASKRPRSRVDEQPKFIGISDDNASDQEHTHKKARYEEYSSVEEDIDNRDSIELVRSSSGHYNLLQQPLHVKRVAEAAITQVEYYLVLKNVFPDGPEKYNVAIRHILVKCAETLKDQDLATKIKTNASYARKISGIPAQRIPIFRGRVKANVTALSGGFFNLDDDDEKKIDWLLAKDRFVFRVDYPNNIVYGGEAFTDPIFAKILLEDALCSSIASKPDEKEIPAPMLALVATAIHAGLVDLKMGKEQDFRGNTLSNKYDDMMDILKDIREESATKYHGLMHGLYRTVTSSGTLAGRSVVRSKNSFLDVSAMPEDD